VISSLSSVDYDKVVSGKEMITPHKGKGYVGDISKARGRDDSFYTQTEALQNAINDNYRAEMEETLAAQARSRRAKRKQRY